MPESRELKNPVVLVHGLGAPGVYGPFDYFHGFAKILRDRRIPFYVARLTPWHTTEWRAQQLKEQLEKNFPDGKLNLIGHSMGGLDSRYLASALGFGERIASITSIGTPHRGTVMSDIASGLVGDGAFSAANRVLKVMGYTSDGFKQIATRYMGETLGPKLRDVPGVAYYSAASAIPKNYVTGSLPLLWVPHRVVKKYEGDNDGFVSVDSARWGKHICTYVGDHYGQIGQILGRSRGLDYLKLYGEILKALKADGM